MQLSHPFGRQPRWETNFFLSFPSSPPKADPANTSVSLLIIHSGNLNGAVRVLFFFNQRADCTLTRLLNSYLLTHDTDMTWWVESVSQDKSRYCCVTDFLPPPLFPLSLSPPPWSLFPAFVNTMAGYPPWQQTVPRGSSVHGQNRCVWIWNSQ